MRYNLLPFPGSPFTSDLQIDCSIERNIDSLLINYNLHGNINELMIPELLASPERRKELWKETCFEFFIAETHSSRYWEVNISPSGHWNVYRFSDYRQGMEEETAFFSHPFSINKQNDYVHLSLDFDLSRIIRNEQGIKVAMSVVIKSIAGAITYYALTHKGIQADFHKRESFIVEL